MNTRNGTVLKEQRRVPTPSISLGIALAICYVTSSIAAEPTVLKRGGERISGVALSKDGSIGITASDQIEVWDTKSGKRVRAFDATGPCALSPDGTTAYVILDGSLQAVDVETGESKGSFGFAPWRFSVSPRGIYLAASVFNGRESRISIRSTTPGKGIPVGISSRAETTTSINYGNDNRFLVAAGLTRRGSIIEVWRLTTDEGRTTGGPLRIDGHRKMVVAADTELIARRVVSVGSDGLVLSTGLADGKVMDQFNVVEKDGELVTAAAISMRSGEVAIGYKSGLIAVWNWKTKQKVGAMTAEYGPVRSIALRSKDSSRQILAGYQNGTVIFEAMK